MTNKFPISLYIQCLKSFVRNLNHNVVNLDRISHLKLLPANILAEIYAEISEYRYLRDVLLEELSDLTVFNKLIKLSTDRQIIFKCFEALMSSGRPIATELQRKFCQVTEYKFLNLKSHLTVAIYCETENSKQQRIRHIECGIRLGGFLLEFGSLQEGLQVLTTVYETIQLLRPGNSKYLLELDCLQRLLHAQTAFCCFKEASRTSKLALQIVKNNCRQIPNSLLASIYQEISVLHFYRSEYDLSYEWSIKSLKHINKNMHPKVIVDVFRQVAKSCVVKRQFNQASMLIQQAVCSARCTFGPNHQKYAEALLDYGFFLLNVDSISSSVGIYKEALEILCRIFGQKNLHVAVAHEDLAYALYVLEYSSGNFRPAQDHVDRAIDIMKELVPCNHLMLASAKRVKALILEEVALDNMATSEDMSDHAGLLRQSEELHRCALQLSLEAFGEINVQTAKHYGNLGRLYQSMAKYEDAEKMHQKAIQIKTDLLGAYDYEVGLSIGHLASLYNYHMSKYTEAEELYLKSIEISLRLFGETYSGLEYDYKGLIHIYQKLYNDLNLRKYSNILDEWRILREEHRNDRPHPIDIKDESPMEEVTRKFFEMCTGSSGVGSGNEENNNNAINVRMS